MRGNRHWRIRAASSRRSIPACAGEPGPWIGPRPTRPVYPRVCGGTAGSPAAAGTVRGLSPRVRGNLQLGFDRRQKEGSIPACAGEPIEAEHPGFLDEVYPRVCGGTIWVYVEKDKSWGLSPRVRGNRRRRRGFPAHHRSIPACAGEPGPLAGCPRRCGVYPRVCGGTSIARAPPMATCGLSPRVRGNHVAGLPRRGIPGSIPACAGEP